MPSIFGQLAAASMRSGPQNLLDTIIDGCLLLAAAWSGMHLARSDFFLSQPEPRRPAALSYVCFSTVMLSFALSNIATFQFLFHELNLIAFGFIAIALTFMGLVLACLGHAVGSLGYPETVPASGATVHDNPWEVTALDMREFWIDLWIGMLITIGLVAIGQFAIYILVPIQVAAFILPILMFIQFLGPMFVFVLGVLRGRIGYIASPVILMLFALIVAHGYRFFSR